MFMCIGALKGKHFIYRLREYKLKKTDMQITAAELLIKSVKQHKLQQGCEHWVCWKRYYTKLCTSYTKPLRGSSWLTLSFPLLKAQMDTW